MSNAIHLDNTHIGGAVTVMEDLERRVENFHKQKTYDEILSEARDGLKEISPQEMTFDEYKAYIEGKLQNIPRNFTRHRDDVTIIISDEGFRAMQSDSDYEKWVLDSVSEELSIPDYLCGYPGTYGRHETLEFGATKEDFRGHSLPIRKNEPPNVEESYWERRLSRLKARLKAEQEIFEQEQLLQKGSEENLRLEAIQRAQAGLGDPFEPEKPIIGVPASYLLSMLAPTP